MAGVLEGRLDRRVLAGRSLGSGDRWVPAPIGPALEWARFAAARLAARSEVVLSTDVEAYYPSLDPAVVYRRLRIVGVEPVDAATAADMLEGWGSDGYPGLPIGPPGSAVVANAVLTAVDRALAGARYLRWVDDYLVAVPSGDFGTILERLDGALDGAGLRRSEAKTRSITGIVRWLGASGVD